MSSVAMPRPAAPGPWARIQDLILPVGLVASVLVILMPVPAELMDRFVGGEHHHRGDYAADDSLRADAAGVQHLPLPAAGHDAVPAGAECGHHAADSHPAAADGDLAAGGVVRTFGEFVTGGATGATTSSSG